MSIPSGSILTSMTQSSGRLSVEPSLGSKRLIRYDWSKPLMMGKLYPCLTVLPGSPIRWKPTSCSKLADPICPDNPRLFPTLAPWASLPRPQSIHVCIFWSCGGEHYKGCHYHSDLCTMRSSQRTCEVQGSREGRRTSTQQHCKNPLGRIHCRNPLALVPRWTLHHHH